MKRCDVSTVKPGDYVTYSKHYRVKSRGTNGAGHPCVNVVAVSDWNHASACVTRISDEAFEEACWHATQTSKEETISRTKASQLIRERSAGRAFSVSFKKKPTRKGLKALLKAAKERADTVTAKEVTTASTSATTTTTTTAAADVPPCEGDRLMAQGFRALADQLEQERSARIRNSILDSLYEGPERTMNAIYAGSVTEFGRTNVIDLDELARTGEVSASRRQLDDRTIRWVALGGKKYTVR
jgi:hypothetical protein